MVSPGTGRVLRGKETGTGVRFITIRLYQGSWTMAWELQRRRGILSSGAGEPGGVHGPCLCRWSSHLETNRVSLGWVV